MKTCLLIALATTLCLLPAAAQQPASGTLGAIERLDPALDKLIPSGAVIEKLANGFDWSEGPVWMPVGGCVLFSDVPRNTVYKWKAGAGVSVFLKPSGYTGQPKPGQREPGSNGLTLDTEGRLVLCEHGDRRVARLEKDGRKTTLADRFEGKQLNSPNDLVFKSNGDLYFTDPPYGLPKLNNDPAKELPFNGVYRLARNGGLALLTKELTFPNGLAFSPDEKTLYVANSDPQRAIWMAYDVKPDGMLGTGRVFFDATPLRRGRKGLPDGMKVDYRGNVFATGPGGVLIFSPDGKHLGTLNTGEATGNCAWGDDGSTLYITADMFLCRVKTTTKGTRF
ncbi:MAG: SMP-30/gluconolactonase/LRE family protein [Verrucomicrobia bacterium]|nr:SMP-30/gluconolactonase/LRE family protein [Verrucomicrobiota bacterium]